MATEWFANRRPQAAIALFTLSLVISGCEGGAPSAPAGVLASRQAQAAGSGIFAANCAICHGADAEGNGPRRAGLNPPPANLTLPRWSEPANAGRTFLVIRNGVRGTAMPAWPAFTDQQIWDVVAYITSRKSQ